MYQFYVDGVLLPVTPEAMKVKITNKNKTVTLINDGEVNILKRAGLSEISFTALLPSVKYPFSQYQNGFQGANYYLSKFESLKTGLKPFKFQVIRGDGSFDTTFTVSLEEYTIDEDADKYGRDVFVTITLLQYQQYVTKTITFQSQGAATVNDTRDTSTKKAEVTYTVKSGDSLWAIARTKLGRGSRYPEIYNLNKDVIESTAKKYGKASSSNGWWIYPGTVLKLPT